LEFPKLNSLSLHARLISNCRNLAIVGRRNLVGAKIQQHPATRILPAPEFGHYRQISADQIPAETGRNTAIDSSRLDLAKMARIWPAQAKTAVLRPDLATDPAGFDRI
jgi:hypothetical protein